MSKHGRTMTGLLTIFLISIVGLALTPSIKSNVDHVTSIDDTDRPGYSAKENATGIIGDNLTRGSARNILLLFPMFWVILMIAIPVTYVTLWLRGS